MPRQSHKHHYVPEWYQRRFLAPSQTNFKILDLKPPQFARGDGSPVSCRPIFTKGPRAFFFEKDLYTTRWLGTPNDDIERFLFGAIDRVGQRAIDAYIAEDWRTVHSTYFQIFEFMDALRLRTPKGLQFVRAFARAKNQQDLMAKMQFFRRIHCVMWVEGVLEIVSAENSPVKFIFSDHPVTFFNSHVLPTDPRIPVGVDPMLEWMGTQTLFPFDQQTLFILTHLEWAQNPGRLKARKPRTNARFYGSPLVNYTRCIRGRNLTAPEVREVNYIIKSRAYRYIAGRVEDDLFPERHLEAVAWGQLGRFLLPQKDKLGEFAGKTYARTADGAYYVEDEFGRRPKTPEEYQEEVKRAKELEETVRIALEKHRAKNKPEGD